MIEPEVGDDYEVDQAYHVDELKDNKYAVHILGVKAYAGLGEVDSESEPKVGDEDAEHDQESMRDVSVLSHIVLFNFRLGQRVIIVWACVAATRLMMHEAENEDAEGEQEQRAVERCLEYVKSPLSRRLPIVSFCLLLDWLQNFYPLNRHPDQLEIIVFLILVRS